METPYQATLPGSGGAETEAPTAVNDESAWPRLGWAGRIIVAGLILLIVLLTVPCLAPGICIGDAGGLQLTCATLGITHPPGYGVYATLGYLVTRVPGIDPAYLVSLLCLASGVAAVTICILLQIRLGVPVGVAGAMGLVFLMHRRVWPDLQVPEVYMPTLAFVTASAYLLIKYTRIGRRRDLFTAAFLYGIAVGSRPPVLFTLPFVLIAWGCARRRWETSWRQSGGSLLIATALGVLPGVYALGYLWVRDTPQTPYNYLEQFNEEEHILPSSEAGPRAKAYRVFWQASGRQFADLMGNNWPGVRWKLWWLRDELLPQRYPWATVVLGACAAGVGGLVARRRYRVSRRALLGVLAAGSALLGIYGIVKDVADLIPLLLSGAALIGVLVVACGAVITYRRCDVALWLLGGMVIGSIVFVCMYRICGHAADILPLLLAGTVLIGVALSAVVSATAKRVRNATATALLLIMVVLTIIRAPDRSCLGPASDATPFLETLDLATMPPDAVICATWHESPSLWYAQYVLTDRSDIHVINAVTTKWWRMVEDYLDRPIFVTAEPHVLKGFTATPYRNVWRMERRRPADTEREDRR